MTRKIDDLSKEELGQLFPIKIVPYNADWTIWFETEKKLLVETLGNDVVLRIEHFGSTSVRGLSAKPTIDILIEIPPLTEQLKDWIIGKMKNIGYDFIWRTDDTVPYMMFVKGYTFDGIKGQSFHIHMGEHTHSLWDRLYFRDYLRQNQKTLKEYEKLKIELAGKYKFDREGYTNAKTNFITTITKRAKTLANDNIPMRNEFKENI
jgi:GrpB-like predicted nucleotidyltransferase (UPF0157 family)